MASPLSWLAKHAAVAQPPSPGLMPDRALWTLAAEVKHSLGQLGQADMAEECEYVTSRAVQRSFHFACFCIVVDLLIRVMRLQ